jgi:hypothetical protein
MLASMYRSLRAARAATFAYFAVNGFVMGTWVVHINVITRQAGVGTATLGYLLLALGGSAFVGMRLCGPLNDRLGPRRVIPVSAALFSAAVVLPALAHNVWSLAGALAALGFSNGCLDVSMNTHAVKVEHRYQRPIMSAFHATWSLGGVLASIVGARTISWGWPIAPTCRSTSAPTSRTDTPTTPDQVAAYVAALGADGINIEDSTDEHLIDPAAHAAKVTAIKRRSPGVFVNARVDTYWLGPGRRPAGHPRPRRTLRARRRRRDLRTRRHRAGRPGPTRQRDPRAAQRAHRPRPAAARTRPPRRTPRQHQLPALPRRHRRRRPDRHQRPRRPPRPGRHPTLQKRLTDYRDGHRH